MHIYALLDTISMNIASLAVRNSTYFSLNTSSKHITELLSLIQIKTPPIMGEGYYRTPVLYEGKQQEAAFEVAQWKGYDYPTIIYHHGAAEGSYDVSFRKILASKKLHIPANLIGIQALYNHNNREFMQSISSLANYVLLLASSTKLIEALCEQVKQEGRGKTIVTGTSLGGFVTNLHFTYFNSADCYIPLLAGARLGEVFLNSAYSKVTARTVNSCPKHIREILNFGTDLQKRDQTILFPLLAQYDQIITYNIHCQDFLPEQITTIPFGHASGATKFNVLREHILKHL